MFKKTKTLGVDAPVYIKIPGGEFFGRLVEPYSPGDESILMTTDNAAFVGEVKIPTSEILAFGIITNNADQILNDIAALNSHKRAETAKASQQVRDGIVPVRGMVQQVAGGGGAQLFPLTGKRHN